MTETAVTVTHATAVGAFNDVTGPSSVNQNFRNAFGIQQLLVAASRIPGMLYMSPGVPGTSPSGPGAFCIDTTNNDIYVCTDRSTPTWTKLAE